MKKHQGSCDAGDLIIPIATQFLLNEVFGRCELEMPLPGCNQRLSFGNPRWKRTLQVFHDGEQHAGQGADMGRVVGEDLQQPVLQYGGRRELPQSIGKGNRLIWVQLPEAQTVWGNPAKHDSFPLHSFQRPGGLHAGNAVLSVRAAPVGVGERQEPRHTGI